MKNLFMTLAALFVMTSVAQAAPFRLIKTCTYPLFDGEYKVYLSADKKDAKVSYSGVKDYPVTNFSLGPVSSFDFVTRMGTERIIIAVDGGHELHLLAPGAKKFSKIEDLTCY